jgi:hypothetical protein
LEEVRRFRKQPGAAHCGDISIDNHKDSFLESIPFLGLRFELITASLPCDELAWGIIFSLLAFMAASRR